ncbi:MAG: helix-turn-helix domain-containing protein [Solirubrobacterales bacterium]
MTTKAGQDQGTKRRLRMSRLKAMSHPLRAECFRLLVERGEMSPSDVSRELGKNLSDVSYHMKRLMDLDCAEVVRERPVRGAVEHFYAATDRPMIDTEEWSELDPLVAEGLVCEFMQMIIDDFVSSRKAGIVGADKDFHVTRTPMALDAEGFEEGMEAYERLRLEMSEIEARSAQRRARSGEPAVPVSSSLLLFKVPRSRS